MRVKCVHVCVNCWRFLFAELVVRVQGTHVYLPEACVAGRTNNQSLLHL
jgi:hypothetical protein